MKSELQELGLNEKEVKVFLYLIEYGVSAASEISKHIWIPKSTINFLADNLWKRGILKKSFRRKTGYYEADISSFESNILSDLEKKQTLLYQLVPELREKNKNIISKPKISFFDGVEACKNEYLKLLKVQDKVFYEFGAHRDLAEAFWDDFMSDFIHQRVKKKVFCDSIWSSWEVENALQKLDEEHYRRLKIFDNDIGNITSSISIYDDSVMILNLWSSCTWVCIENREFAETMKTIFLISQKSGN